MAFKFFGCCFGILLVSFRYPLVSFWCLVAVLLVSFVVSLVSFCVFRGLLEISSMLLVACWGYLVSCWTGFGVLWCVVDMIHITKGVADFT